MIEKVFGGLLLIGAIFGEIIQAGCTCYVLFLIWERFSRRADSAHYDRTVTSI